MLPAAVPRLIVGTAHLGSPLPNPFASASEQARFAELDALVELGCTAFDLGASYMLGGTERLFGQWIASRRNRDRLYLISKGGHPYPIVGEHRLHRAALEADLDASLKRLGTERLDLYLAHRDDETEPLERLLETFLSFVRAGKIAAWGVSNWRHSRIQALDQLARAAGTSVSASSPQLSLVEWTRPPWKGCVSIAGPGNREARTYYQQAQLPVLAWSPLAAGFFTEGAPKGQRAYGSSANLAARARAEELGRRHGVGAAEIALCWVLSQPFPVHAIVGSTSATHVKRNQQAARMTLSPAELGWLESGEDRDGSHPAA